MDFALHDFIRTFRSNVVVDKRGRDDEDIFGIAWRNMLNAFDEALRNNILPKPDISSASKDRGFLVVDQTNEEKLRALIDVMRTESEVEGCRQLFIVEDPMHKNSEQSLPIQLSDANAYFLLQMIAPNSTVRRHKARNFFYLLEPILLKELNPANPLGIVFA